MLIELPGHITMGKLYEIAEDLDCTIKNKRGSVSHLTFVPNDTTYQPPLDKVCPGCGTKHTGGSNRCSDCLFDTDHG